MAHQVPQKKTVFGTIGALLLVVIGGYFGVDLVSDAQDPGAPTGAGLPTCPLAQLPEEAEETAATIRAGGPFEYPDNDGTRFGNYEGVLPDEDLGYYREYTVDTPGLDHRGARRIVTGGGTEPAPDVWYYTHDHYESFCEIPDAA